jgi:hypothetical protein
MRDYYNLIKMLKRKMDAQQGGAQQLTDVQLLTEVVCRNFGGHRQLLKEVFRRFLGKGLGLSKRAFNLPSCAVSFSYRRVCLSCIPSLTLLCVISTRRRNW